MVLILVLLLMSPSASAEVLDKMGGCAGRDPWFAAAIGLGLLVLFARTKLILLAISQVFTAVFFFDSLVILLGVVFGGGDPVWQDFSREITSCERYEWIGFWPMQAAAFLVWFAPLVFVFLRQRRS